MASVRLVKGTEHPTKSREGTDENEEKEQMEKMKAELKCCEAFILYASSPRKLWIGQA